MTHDCEIVLQGQVTKNSLDWSMAKYGRKWENVRFSWNVKITGADKVENNGNKDIIE